MAAHELSLEFQDVTLSVNAWKGLISCRAAANVMVKILGCRLATSGVSGSEEPLRFRLRNITPGNGTATTVTPARGYNGFTATPQLVSRKDFTGTQPTDATPPNISDSDMFHPQGGMIQSWEFRNKIVKEGTEVLVEVFVPSGGSASKCSGHLDVEE
jgi:hypothetical protein